jgi:antirestriction protein ArdC
VISTPRAPWVKPWTATAGQNVPCNAFSNRPYSGCNVVLLWTAANTGSRTPRYATFQQALELGGHVRKGEHGHRVYFVKQLQVREAATMCGSSRCCGNTRFSTSINAKGCLNG